MARSRPVLRATIPSLPGFMARMQRAAIIAVLAAVLLAVAPGAGAATKPGAPKGFFGVMWDRAAVRGSPEHQEDQWALMARSGVESARLVFSWAAMQPTAGGPDDYRKMDERVAAAARHGIRV